MNSKTEFLENISSPEKDYSKCFVFEICRNEKFSIQNLTFCNFFRSNFHCTEKLLLQILIPFFFWKISFQMLIFNEKVCYKVMPFKMSTQNEKLVVVGGANRVKTLFLRRDVLIEIWFLNKNWTQNLIFSKILSPQNDFSKSISSKYAWTKNSRFKNWSICRKKLHFKTRIFFQKVPFQNLIFNEKVCFKIMPFKMSTQSQILLFSAEEIKSKRYFLDVMFWWKSDFSIKIEIENWVSGKYFFSKIWLFEKFLL